MECIQSRSDYTGIKVLSQFQGCFAGVYSPFPNRPQGLVNKALRDFDNAIDGKMNFINS
jgi:hypothetical protein